MTQNEKDIIKEFNTTVKNMKKFAQEFEKGTEGFSKEKRAAMDAEVKQLKEKLKILKESSTIDASIVKEAEKNLKYIERQNRALKEQHQVVGRITQEIASTGSKYTDFLMSTAAQYNLAQNIAKEYRGITKDLGLGSNSAKLLEKSFKRTLPDVIEMGLEASDLRQVYTEMAESSGRITPVSEADANAIASVAAGTGMMASDATKMAESFNLMGVTSEKMEDHLFETYKSAQSMGLNATKVIKVLQQNMKSLQSYSFAGGVKGMTEMAKQAVKMRLDVRDVLQMADKFYQPEAAIEAAANLQMLGGDIAEAFGDPFETMYLARNKPEELAKKLGDMTENMMQFNEETGEYEFPAEVRMQLKSAGEQLGINTDKMIEMARQTSKIKDIKMKFTQIGDMDEAENLASLAKWSDERNEFVIKHDGEELGLDQINDGMADDIMKANQTSEETFRDIAINTQVMSEKMDNFLESQKAKAVTATDMYEITQQSIEKTFVSVREGMKKSTEAWIEKGSAMIEGMFADSGESDALLNLNDEMQLLTTSIKDGTIESFNDLSKVMDGFTKKYGNLEQQGNNVSADDLKKKRQDHCKKHGSTYDEATGMCADGVTTVPMAKGGIVTSPTHALIGEGSEPEAVLPLSRLDSMVGNQKTEVSGTATINVNINSNTAISSNMESVLTSKIIEVYQKIANGDGNVSSVYQAQPSKGSDILYA